MTDENLRHSLKMLGEIKYKLPAIGTQSASDTEQQVITDILTRQQIGIKKYGTTLANNPLPLRDWLEHAYQECLDQALYLRRAIEEIDKEKEQ